MGASATYRIAFEADTSKIKAALEETNKLIQSLGDQSLSKGLTAEMRTAANAASELQGHLKAAFNTETGKIDLTKFQQSLKASGTDLDQYADKLNLVGKEGREAFYAVASAITQSEAPIFRMNAALDKLWTTMKNTMRWQLTTSVLQGFTGQIEQAYGYAKNLDASLANIRIVTGNSADDMARFAKEANNAAKRLSTTTVNYSDAALIYYQQGDSEEQVRAKTEATIKMANVTKDSVEEVSDQLTAIWNNFDDGTKALTYYTDALVALGAATASSSAEISNGLQQFAAAADTVGLSFDYAATALATITAETRQSENVVGTGLRTLFTRVQGLSLNEEQEDGTDLNKYSKALADVGVNIKDTSGELKSMDQILDELGAKWKNLGEAQQVALAQTVGGVRQYTQLIALMDNWDTFQENLAIAQTSTGALEEQAEIYAESWEAARNRVKAAAEDVYDSVIDEEVFIKLADTGAEVLDFVANIVDGLGGMQGMLLTLGTLGVSVFKDKIAGSLREAGQQLLNLTGFQKNTNLNFQKKTADIATSLSLREDVPESEVQQNDFNNQMLQLNIALAEVSERLTEAEKQTVQAQKEGLLVAQEKLQTLMQENELQAKIMRAQIDETFFATDENGQRTTTTWNRDGTAQRSVQAVEKMGFTSAKAKSLDSGGLRAFVLELDKIGASKTKIDAVEEAITNIQTSANRGTTDVKKLSQLLENLGKDFDFIQASLQDADLTTQDGIVKATNQALIDIGEERKRIETLIQKFKDYIVSVYAKHNNDNSIDDDVKEQAYAELDTVQQRGEARGYAEGVATINTQDQMSALGNLQQGLDQTAHGARNVADQITGIMQASFGVFETINSLKTINDILKDDTLSKWDKFTAIATSLSSVSMGTISVINGLTTAIGLEEGALVKNTVTKTANTIATKLMGVANLEAATTAQALGASMLAIGGWVAIATAAIAALTVVIKAISNAYKAQAEEAKRAAAAAEDLAAAHEEVKNQISALESAFGAYETAKNKLDDCTKGTTEWKEALIEVNEVVLQLLQDLPELANLIQWVRNDDGSIEITNMDEVMSTMEQREEQAQVAAILAQNRSQVITAVDASGRGLHGDLVSGGVSATGADLIADNLTSLFHLTASEFETKITGIFEQAEKSLGIDLTTDLAILLEDGWQGIIDDLAINTDSAMQQMSSSADLLTAVVLADKEYADSVLSQASDVLLDVQQSEYDTYINRIRQDNATEGQTKNSQEIWAEFQRINGTTYQAAGNQIRDEEGERRYYYYNDKNELNYYTAEYIASVIAADHALIQMKESAEGFSDYYNSLQNNKAKEFTTDFVNSRDAATGEYNGADYFAGLTLQAIQEFLALDLTEESLNTEEAAIQSIFGMTIQEFTDLATAIYQSEDALELFINALNSGAEEVVSDEENSNNQGYAELYFGADRANAMTIEQQDSFATNMRSLTEKTSDLGIYGIGAIASNLIQEKDVDTVNAILGALGSIDYSVEGADEALAALLEEFGITGPAVDFFVEEVAKIPKTLSISTSAIAEERAKLQNIVGEGLEVGDIISAEDFAILEKAGINVNEYFALNADGTYTLIGLAEEFNATVNGITYDKLKGQIDDYQESRSAVAEKYGFTEAAITGTTVGVEGNARADDLANARLEMLRGISDVDYSSLDAGTLEIVRNLLADINREGGYTQTELQAVSEAIGVLNGQEVNTEGQLFKTATTLEELNGIAEDLGTYSLEGYSEGLINLAGQYDNTKQAIIDYQNALATNNEDIIGPIEEQLEALVDLNQAANKYGLEAKTLEKQAKNIAKQFGISADEATALAVKQARVERGVADLAESWEDWEEILENSNEQTTKYNETVIDLTEVIGDLTNAGEGFELPDGFLDEANNLLLLEQAAQGDVTAIQNLGIALANAEVEAMEFNAIWGDLQNVQTLNPDINFGNFETAKQTVIDGLGQIQTAIANGELAVGQSIDSIVPGWTSALNQLALNTGMTVGEMNGLLSSVNMEADVGVTYVNTSVDVPVYREKWEPDGEPQEITQGIDLETMTPIKATYQNMKKSITKDTEKVTGRVPVAQISTDDSGVGYANIGTTTYTGPPVTDTETGTSTTTGGGGGGGGVAAGKPPEIELDQERYHEIDRQIGVQENLLSDVDKELDRVYGTDRLEKFAEKLGIINKQLENSYVKLNEAYNYLPGDIADVEQRITTVTYDTAGNRYESEQQGFVVFDEYGEITNYDEIEDIFQQKYQNAYDTYMAWWNSSWVNLTDEQRAEMQDTKKIMDEMLSDAKDQYDEDMESLAQLEETVDVVREMEDAIDNLKRQASDLKLDRIEYTLQVRIDLKDLYDELKDMEITIAEAFGDALTHGRQIANLDIDKIENAVHLMPSYIEAFNELKAMREQALEEMAMYGETWIDTEALAQQFQDLATDIAGSVTELVEYAEQLEDVFVNALDAAISRFDALNEQLDHNASVISNIRELYSLQGINGINIETIKPKEIKDFPSASERGINKTTKEEIEALRAELDNTNESARQLEISLEETMYLKKEQGKVAVKHGFEWDWSDPVFNALNQEMYTVTTQAQLQRQWLDELAIKLEDAEIALANATEGDGSYDMLKKNRDALLEEHNATQQALLESTQSAIELAQELYEAKLDAIMRYYENVMTGGTGFDDMQTRYDHFIEEEERYLDSVNSAYQVANWYNKIQADIEKSTSEAQKARLQALYEELKVRQENGTLSEYDLEIMEAKYNVALAEMALEDQKNAKTELRLMRDSQGNYNYQFTASPDDIDAAEQELLDYQNDYYNIAKDRLTEISSQEIATAQEAMEAIKEINSDLTLSEEEKMQKIEEIQRYYNEKMKYIEEEKQVAITDMAQAGEEALMRLYTDYNEQMAGIIGEIPEGLEVTGGLIMGATETYGADILDLTNVLWESGELIEEVISAANTNFEELEDTIDVVNEAAGTDLEDLNDTIKNVTYSTTQLGITGPESIEAWWDELDKLWELSDAYSTIADNVWKVIDAYQNLPTEIYNEVNDMSGGQSGDKQGYEYYYNDDLDYRDLIGSGIAAGYISYGDSYYNQLMNERGNKISTEGMSNEEIIVDQDEADKEFKNLEKGTNPYVGVSQYWNSDGTFNAEKWSKDFWDNATKALNNGPVLFDSGGYTGDFNNGRLAVLHEKELVLNQEDTSNILAAVAAVRTLGPELFSSIESILDTNAIASMGAIAGRIAAGSYEGHTTEELQQNVQIEAHFPNVTNSSEIEEAMMSLVNDASQWALRRKQ